MSQLFPQESRFPVPRPAYGLTEPPNTGNLPLHQLAASPLSPRKAPIVGPHISNGDHERNRRLSLLLSDDTEYSLEDSKDFTAHFVGLPGEQDTNLFASIRYNVLNETNFVDFNIRQVFPSEAPKGSPPIHFSILQDSCPERDKQANNLASDALEVHVDGFGDVLLKLYFRFVHKGTELVRYQQTEHPGIFAGCNIRAGVCISYAGRVVERHTTNQSSNLV